MYKDTFYKIKYALNNVKLLKKLVIMEISKLDHVSNVISHALSVPINTPILVLPAKKGFIFYQEHVLNVQQNLKHVSIVLPKI